MKGQRTSRLPPAAGMILAGVPAEGQADEGGDGPELVIARYASAGINAFLFAGATLLDPDRLASLARLARTQCAEAGLGRALIAIGGFPGPGFGLPPFPAALSPLGLAALGSISAAKRSGRLIGLALAACGVDLLLAPRLDLATDPKALSGVLDGFGQDHRLVSRLASAFVRGLSSTGVASCAGRFPGLGSTCAECFDGISFVALPPERMESVEMRPFGAAIGAGVDAIVVGRAFVPAFESERIPAARSARIVEGRLRAQLGFKGLVIGDELGLESGKPSAVVLGALAGCDLTIVAKPAQALLAASAMAAARASGEMPEPRLHVAGMRLARFLAARPSRPRALSPKASLLSRIERDRGESLAILRGAPMGAFPDKDLLLVVFTPPKGSSDAGETQGALEILRAAFPTADLIALPSNPGLAEAESLGQGLSGKRHAAAVILSYDAHLRPAQEGLSRLIEESVPRTVVVAMRDPYDAAFFPRAEALVAAFGFSAAGVAAVARLLSGQGYAAGRSPVEVIGIEL